MIGPTDIPFLPRGVRVHYDAVRGFDVLLGPERVVMLDEIGKSILTHTDGASDIRCIAKALAAQYDAPQDVIEPDVSSFLQDLVEKGFVHVAP